MKYKPDWDEAAARYADLWNRRPLDRPCMTVTAPSGAGHPVPEPPDDPERRWLDPEWVGRNIRAALENTWWGGEAVPSYLLMGGWTVSLGGRPKFSLGTIWFETFQVDFDKPSPFVIDLNDEWIKKHERLYLSAAEMAGKDDFQLGKPCLLPANDLLSMHMGTTEFLTALADEPEWMENAIRKGAEELLGERMRLRDMVADHHEYWYGNAGWMPFWAPEPYCPTQSDVSCMVSPEMFERFIVPELTTYGESFGAMWYHLDGHDAQQHLPRLLSFPFMRVMQYVPTPAEPPNGPGHLNLYRRIQKAGCIVHVQVNKKDVEAMIKGLDHNLLVLDVRCDSPDEGKELLEAAVRWSESAKVGA